MMQVLRVLVFCWLGAGAYAQPGTLDLPILGFTPGLGGKTLRAIHGVPGASWLGAEVTSGFSLDAMAVSPTHDFALGTSVSDEQILLMRLAPAGGRATPVAAIISSPSQIVFSPSGRSAVVAGAVMQIVSGLPDSPKLRQITPPPGGGMWPAIAVSDDGDSVLLASGGADADPVWLIRGGRISQVPLPGSVKALAFRANAAEAIAITRRGDVFVIGAPGENVHVQQIHYGDDRTADPIAASFAPDGRRAYAASRSGMLATISVDAIAVAAISCECVPTTLASLGSEGVFRITEVSASPVMLFDARGSEPRLWFVPPDAAPPSQQRAQ